MLAKDSVLAALSIETLIVQLAKTEVLVHYSGEMPAALAQQDPVMSDEGTSHLPIGLDRPHTLISITVSR
ncbi:MAG: hypothetical protein GWN58_50450 [Anaerolineae bacterium]|nr:hypothetical protein [Anaerolineae bacterium]